MQFEYAAGAAGELFTAIHEAQQSGRMIRWVDLTPQEYQDLVASIREQFPDSVPPGLAIGSFQGVVLKVDGKAPVASGIVVPDPSANARRRH